MFGLYRLGVGDLVEGMEPVVGVLGQPFEQSRDGVGADVNDGLVGWVSDHLGDVYAPGALLEPFVGQSLELHSIARQAGVCFVYCAGCGRDLDRFVPFSAGAWGPISTPVPCCALAGLYLRPAWGCRSAGCGRGSASCPKTWETAPKTAPR